MKAPALDVISERLRSQKLTRTDLRKPADVVAWLGAVQAQDYPTAKWGLGLRATGLTDAAVDRAFDDGAILRTHVMRPTWHFVTPADIRWILALTGPRVHAVNAYYYRKAGLDARVLARSRTTLERALQGGRHLTRSELAAALGRAGIPAAGLSLAYVMMHAELEQVICSGARRGKQFTYALLDERVPHVRVLDRDEALAELTRRYFSSHGPATVKDYVWWSGLTMRDARIGIDMVKPALANAVVDGLTYWFAPRTPAPPPSAPTAHLAPNYDEYLIAYKDRQAVGKAMAAEENPGPIDAYAQFLIVDGLFSGTWRRTVEAGTVLVRAVPSRRLTRGNVRSLEAAANAFGRFMELPVALTL